MKTAVKRLFCFILATIIFTMGCPAFAAADTQKIKIGFYTMPGFQNVDDNGILSGYMYDYLQEISKYTGWKYEFYTGDFSDCLAKLEAGALDFMSGMQMTEERKDQFEFPTYSCGEMYTGLYVLGDNLKYAYDDTESFHGISVGVIAGVAGNKDFDAYCAENGIHAEITEYASDTELTAALENGDVEAICALSCNTYSAYRRIEGFTYKPFYMMAAKGRTELVHQLDTALETIKVQNPFYEKNLWEQYFPVKKDTIPVFTKKELEYIQNTPEITAVYNKSMIPLERYNEETGEYDGVIADIFHLISKLSGLKFNFVAEDSYKNAYIKLKNKDVQIICSTARDFEWAELHNAKISQEYLNVPIVMVSNSKRDRDKPIVAMPEGLYITNLIETNFTDYQYVEYEDWTACYNAVSNGEADATFSNSYMAREYLSKSKFSELKAVSLSGYSMRYCVGFSNNVDDILVSIIDKTLACISDDQINEFIVADTMTYTPFSLFDLIYQNPAESILIIVAVFVLFILLLLLIIRNKTKYAKKLNHLLNVDELTNAPSFIKFKTDAQKLLSGKTSREYLLMYMNLSKFKDINDMYGYSMGDTILKCVSDQLKSSLRDGELFARMYADRFAILLINDGKDIFEKRYTVFLKELSKFRCPCKLHFTIGAYVLSANDNNISLAIDRATYAHEQCNADDMKNVVFYDEKLKEKILKERTMEAEMEQALSNGGFKVYYQPKINSMTNKVAGAEALIRWQRSENELISPAEFIPLFERNGFVLKTDFFVFGEVCRYLRTRKETRSELFPISCNFSRLHFLSEDFLDKLTDIADRYGIVHELLEIEITETVAVEDIEIVRAQLVRLKEKNFSISIDDFGSGYSSLGILSEIPFDVIKLDRSLIMNALNSNENRMILSGIISTIKSLDKKIVCEGVDDKAQIDFLKSLDCCIIQGYFYSKPLPETEFDRKYEPAILI